MEHSGDGSGEYPGSMRPRLRRILGFLKHHRLFDTAHALEKETQVFFDLAHVERMIMHRRWEEADHYLSRFVTAGESRLSTELLLRIRTLRILDKVADGDKAWVANYCSDNKAFFEAILKGAEASKLFTSLDCRQACLVLRIKQIRLGIVEMVKKLVAQNPLLIGDKKLWRSWRRPSEVIPLGLRRCQRRQMKRVGHVPAHVVACLVRQNRLRYSLRDPSDDSLQAAKPSLVSSTAHPFNEGSKIHRQQRLQSSGHQGLDFSGPITHSRAATLCNLRELQNQVLQEPFPYWSLGRTGSKFKIQTKDLSRDESGRSCDTTSLRLLEIPEKVSRLMYTSSGQSIVALTSNGVLKIWKWNESTDGMSRKDQDSLPDQLSIQADPLSCFCFSMSGDGSFAVFGAEQEIALFDILNFKAKAKLWGRSSLATCIAVHPQNSNIIAVGFRDSCILIYNNYAHTVNCLRAHEGWITGLAFSVMLNVLISSGSDDKLVKWNMGTWTESVCVGLKLPKRENEESKLPVVLPGLNFTAAQVQFHRDQLDFLVVHNSLLAVYDAKTMQRLHEWLPNYTTSIMHATYSWDGNLIYASFRDGRVAVLHIEEKLVVRGAIDPASYLNGEISSGVHAVVIAAHPSKQNELALGLSDGGVVVLEATEKDNETEEVAI